MSQIDELERYISSLNKYLVGGIVRAVPIEMYPRFKDAPIRFYVYKDHEFATEILCAVVADGEEYLDLYHVNVGDHSLVGDVIGSAYESTGHRSLKTLWEDTLQELIDRAIGAAN